MALRLERYSTVETTERLTSLALLVRGGDKSLRCRRRQGRHGSGMGHLLRVRGVVGRCEVRGHYQGM